MVCIPMAVVLPAMPEPPADGNLADQLINSALRYRGQAPLVDAILKEIGIDGGDIKGLRGALQLDDKASPETEE